MKKFFSNFIHNTKLHTKAISCLLILLLFFYAIPTVIYGEVADAIAAAGEDIATVPDESAAVAEAPDIYSYEGVAYEAVELREESAKHFHLEDGSYVAAQYAYPVHIADEGGKLIDINNTLAEASGGVYANPSARIKFAKKITGNGNLFTLHDGNTKLTFSLVGAIKKTAGEVTNGSDAECETELQKMMNLEGLTSRIIYRDILEGVDVEYVAESLNIKENIIVKQRAEGYSYTFELGLNGLTAALADGGAIVITNTSSGKVQYTIPAPVVYDANYVHAPASAAGYTLLDGGNGKYTLTVSVSDEWMNSEDRAYPVTVDPSLGYTNSVCSDTYINQSAPTSTYNTATNIPLNSGTKAYWKTPSLANLPTDSYITGAFLAYRCFSSTSAASIAAYRVTSSWNALTFNYRAYQSNSGAYSSNVMDIFETKANIAQYATWDITDAVKGWYSGEYSNYGIALAAIQGETNIYSLDVSLLAPYAYVTYTDLKGRESYWPTSSHSAGAAGSGSVNLATGQLSLAIPTLSTTDSLMPYTPTLVYDSALAGKDYTYAFAQTVYADSYMPYGFKLNMCEAVSKKSVPNYRGNNVTRYIWADADGTEHAFFSSANDASIFVDEDGLQIRLWENSDGTLSMTDDSDTVKTFTEIDPPGLVYASSWYLSKITDKYGNELVFNFDLYDRPIGISLKPVAALSEIEMLRLSYYDNGKLKMIWNPTTNDAVIFRCTEAYNGTAFSTTAPKYLRRIDYVKGTSAVTEAAWNSYITSESNNANISVYSTASYTYDETGHLVSIKDNKQNQSINYTWASSKVTKATQMAGATIGQEIAINYYNTYTEVVGTGNDDVLVNELGEDKDNIITRYIFDRYGRAVRRYTTSRDGTEIYNASYGTYETQENIKNNIKEQGSFLHTDANYLLNGNFESYSNNSFAHWYTSGNVTAETFYTVSGLYSPKLQPTRNTGASIYQTMYLYKGTYTFSMDYVSKYASGYTGSLSVYPLGGSNCLHTEEFSLNSNLLNGAKAYFSSTFEITEGSLAVMLKISITPTETNASYDVEFFIDNLMLKKGNGASEFNIISYGNFEDNILTPDETLVPISDYWTTDTSSQIVYYYGNAPFGRSIQLTGNALGERYVKQRIYEAPQSTINQMLGNTGAKYAISGFAKAAQAIGSSRASFRLRVDITYYQGPGKDDVIVSHYFDFLDECKDWQYTSGIFDTARESTGSVIYSCMKAIDVYCEYSYQPNWYAVFDDISVVRLDEKSANGSHTYTYYGASDGVINGLLKSDETLFYKEYYEYDEDRNITRIANNKGELTDYVYENGVLNYTLDCDFTYNSGYNYPINVEYAEDALVVTPKTKTEYTYDNYGLCTSIETILLDSSGEPLSGSKSMITSYEYNTLSGSKLFGALLSTTGADNVTVRYYYDNTNGRLLATINEDSGEGTCYTYDSIGKLIGVTPATYVSSVSYTPVTNSASVSYTYNDRDLLSTISTESTTYTFNYDAFGNSTSIGVGTGTLASHEYNAHNGKLVKTTYGNGYVIEYIYNRLELLSEIWYTVGENRYKAYEYDYTADGKLYKYTDVVKGKSTIYKYDDSDRLVSFAEYEVNDMYHDYSAELSYNSTDGLLDSILYRISYINGTSASTAQVLYIYSYDNDRRIESETIDPEGRNITIDYEYDDFGRLIKRNIACYNITHTQNIVYATDGDHTSSRVDSYSYTAGSGIMDPYEFTYDDNGNIVQMLLYDAEYRFVYDDHDQLLREDDPFLYETRIYTYDNAGNITSMTIYEYTDEESPTGGTVYTYGYTNSAWGDQLTSYRGQSITYDAVGNPLTYYNGQSYTFTWEGRLLVGATVGDKVMTFTYNDEGIRTSKTVNGVTTNYYLDGSRIVGEETNGNIKLYFYDASGAPIGMEYHGADYAEDVWDLYWYGKNLQGDVTAVYRNDGLYIYGYYSAFGDTYEDDFMFYADFNPFRYRGYYYDSDLGMYYLNSRYYDTNTCRFINADGYVSTGTGLLGYNMYAYCNNNPIKYVDPSGRSIIGAFLICCLIGGSVVVFSSCGKDVDDLSEKEQKAIDFANNVEPLPDPDDQTVDYSFDTDDFLESVAPDVRDVFYERLHERSKEIAEEAEMGTDNLMSVEHIKWEVEIHLMGYGIFSACDNIYLNHEETYGSLCDRAIKEIDDKITEIFGGDIPWIIPQ